MATKQKSNYKYLRDKWIGKHKELQKNLWDKHKDIVDWVSDNSKQLALGSVSGLMLLTPTVTKTIPNQAIFASQQEFAKVIDKSVFLISDLFHVLPSKVRELTPSEEDVITQTLTRHFGFRVTPELQGIRLNRSYGYIGAEQHLTRYSGDTMSTHFDNQTDAQKFFSSGMAPGLGAWGYFAKSRSEFTTQDYLREKYYSVAQTLYLPNWNQDFVKLRDWYKYRKVVIVNVQNGKIIIADIADSGPAAWTGKHFGGSPEVMAYLGLNVGMQKGAVVLFFVDDANNEIPLGPVEYNFKLR